MKGKIILGAVLVAVAALAVIGYSVVQKINSVTQAFDTIQYNKESYDLMISYFKADSAFQKQLHEEITAGDSSAIQMGKLLVTPYEQRYESGVDEEDIKALMFAYTISTKVLGKFKKLDDDLKALEDSLAPKNVSDSMIKQQLDSLRKLAGERKPGN
ncbi:MAG TPA: hypothetical protein VFU05_00665 [Cyclobacteriaceae bacterium]|nr:hypothetical protein [Cyclobacteriaceae bacterium]